MATTLEKIQFHTMLPDDIDSNKRKLARETVDLVLEVQVERKKVADAMAARDIAVQKLADTCISLRQKATIIERLQQEASKANPASHSQDTSKLKQEVFVLEGIVKSLQAEICTLKDVTLSREESNKPLLLCPQRPPLSRQSSSASLNSSAYFQEDINERTVHFTVEAEDSIKARNELLASIPLPLDAAHEDVLPPFQIPSSITIHEFLSNLCNAIPSLRQTLANYRTLQEFTTSWCPDREEHGYFLTPVFKCSTNPRVMTAHRWMAVDILGRAGTHTECFYTREGKWYYAGIYKTFRLQDLTVKEWEALSNETTQAIIRETIASRKNTSPQNVYEMSQLYAAGALRVACIGLQCVGFNKTLYAGITDYLSTNKVDTNLTKGLGFGSTYNRARTTSLSEAMKALRIDGEPDCENVNPQR